MDRPVFWNSDGFSQHNSHSCHSYCHDQNLTKHRISDSLVPLLSGMNGEQQQYGKIIIIIQTNLPFSQFLLFSKHFIY